MDLQMQNERSDAIGRDSHEFPKRESSRLDHLQGDVQVLRALKAGARGIC